MRRTRLNEVPNGQTVHHGDTVALRQQPETAEGAISVSLEDQTGLDLTWLDCGS